MGNLRLHNAHRLQWWLDGQRPNSLPGRMPQETVMEGHKLESSVLIKGEIINVIDAYYRLKSGVDSEGRPLTEREKDWLKRMVESHDLLGYLTNEYLREKAEDPSLGSERARWQLMYSASRSVLLPQYEAGGYTYLEKLEKMGKNNYKIRTVAQFARMAFDAVLDELDRRDFRLVVAEDKRAKDKYEAMVQDRPSVIDAHESYRVLAEQRRELVCAGMGSKEATEKVAKSNDVPERKVYRAVKFVREENGDADKD